MEINRLDLALFFYNHFIYDHLLMYSFLCIFSIVFLKYLIRSPY
jgi:hypothetical protein